MAHFIWVDPCARRGEATVRLGRLPYGEGRDQLASGSTVVQGGVRASCVWVGLGARFW